MPDLQSMGGGLAIVGAVVAVLRRKHAVGGWLFYFFCQVLLGLALVGASTHFRLYLPRAWNNPARYFLYTVSNLSRVVLLAAIGVLCIVLVETRKWQWVCALRYGLGTYAFLTVVKLPVDIYCFPVALYRDTLSLAFPLVWMVYFSVSVRVRRVFREKRI